MISGVGDEISITGQKIITTVNGVATFDELYFIAEPGSVAVEYQIQISSLDQQRIQTAKGTEISGNQKIYLNFRNCTDGETVLQRKCELCSYGQFSLGENSQQCQQCLNNAICEGGDRVRVNQGFWRSSNSSLHIIECLYKQACMYF